MVLEAGDALYLPRGYVHAASTTDEPSVHLTVGVLSTTWYDVLPDTLALAADELAFRDALPMAGTPADALPGLLARAGSLARRAAGRRSSRTSYGPGCPGRCRPSRSALLGPVAAAPRGLDATTPLRPRDGLAPTVTEAGGQPSLARPARQDGDAAGGRVQRGVRRLLEGPCTPGDMAVGGLDGDDALVLARRMLREGAVLPG